jgi:hypothetical protein
MWKISKTAEYKIYQRENRLKTETHQRENRLKTAICFGV